MNHPKDCEMTPFWQKSLFLALVFEHQETLEILVEGVIVVSEKFIKAAPDAREEFDATSACVTTFSCKPHMEEGAEPSFGVLGRGLRLLNMILHLVLHGNILVINVRW